MTDSGLPPPVLAIVIPVNAESVTLETMDEANVPPSDGPPVELPPNVPAEPSHGGAARNEPGDAVAHPTASTYPHGSASDLQYGG